MRYFKILAVLFLVFVIAVIFSPAQAQEKPEIFVQMGHTNDVNSVAFSPDGRFALSGGWDKTLKLWDVTTGREIRTFTGHTRIVKSVAFSPDGRFALSGSEDDTLKLWDVTTGREIRIFTGHRSYVYSVAFSHDGRYVLSGSMDDTLKLWDISTGKEIRTFTGHADDVNSVTFSPNGRFALSGSRDKTLKLWDISTGKEIRTFTGHTKEVNSVAFSPDGKYGISADEGKIILWEIATGKEIRQSTGDIYVRSVAFSPDGRYALSGGGREVKLWDIATGKEIRQSTGDTWGIISAVFSPDGKYALSGGSAGIQLWDVATGREIRTFFIYQLTSFVYSIAFSPDGRYALSGNFVTLKLWDVTTGREIRTFKGDINAVNSVAFSPNGKYALSQGDGKVELWDIATGKKIRTFKGDSYVRSVAFSPDGRFALSGSEGDNTLKLWDISTGKEIRTFTGHTRIVKSVAFSPDGKYAVSGSFDNNLKLWDISTGREIRTFKGHAADVNSVAFSPDGKYALSGSRDKTLKLWDISTGREIRTFTGHTSYVNSVTFSPDGRFALSGSDDLTTRLWDIFTGIEIAQFISFTDGEWIVLTPEGYYNSSANGDKHLNVRIGNNVYGIDQYRSTFYKPQIVEAALKLGDIQKAVADVVGETKIALPTVSTIQNIEPPFVVIKSPEDGKKMASLNTEISLYVEDRNQTIKKITIYINGRIAASGESRGVKILSTGGGIEIPEGKKTLDLKIPVALESGENLIEVIAFNGYSEGRRAIRLYSEAKAAKAGEVILPNLWILAIGINKYQDKKLTPLSYAVADADGIVNAFKGQKGKLFREINSLIISDSSSIKPTFDNIIDNLSYVKKAGTNDVVLLFIAGHGINDDSGEFYFLPSDAVISEDGSIKKSKAISWREIKAILDIPAKKLIFADTCHSEGVSGKKTRGVDNDRFVKELQEANAVIFTSSRGRELSQESDKWKHGAFTYAIIEGISGKADLIKDNKISMKELDTYVSETVPQITNGAQHPITNTPDGYVNFPVAVLE